MKILYLDCHSGISGNMMLGALIELGVPTLTLEQAFRDLGQDTLRLSVEKRDTGNAIFATHVTVLAGEVPAEHSHDHHHDGDHHHDHHHRSHADIREMIASSALHPEVKRRSLSMFARLAQAEARVHNTSVDDVHFHEVGALDSIGDIVGVAAGMHALGVSQVVVSSLPLGTGTVHTQHGLLPLPAPATQLLLSGALTHGTDITSELVTPTGAAIVAEYANDFGAVPPMRVISAGHGAGTRRIPGRSNSLRAILGDVAKQRSGRTLSVLEANIDDMIPEHLEGLVQSLFSASARDVWWTPITMKRGRPALCVSALCDPENTAALRECFFVHSSTLGVREHAVERFELEREITTVETPWGAVAIKIARDGDRTLNIAPEHRSVAEVAAANGVSQRAVYDAALVAAHTSTRG